jgi:asparagine synthase (glutamine-hydrolysing)
MCGLAGFVDGDHHHGRSVGLEIARRMGDALTHRGPDDAGLWWDDAGVALAHRRLAVVDLSAAGHQPMRSPSERYVIVYNGEIYNFQSLRRDLEDLGARFRGGSDTEVLLAAIDSWGLEVAIDRINGMFAFALWDRKERTLHLVRDRLGKKPFYFGWANHCFLFASELKALHAHPDFAPEIDRGAIALLLRYGYVPGPHSIYRGIFKLPPAGHLALPSGSGPGHQSPLDQVRIYWSLREVVRRGVDRPLQIAEPEAVERLERLLTDAVARRMVADVPLGAFLSGGIDSSAVVALMQTCSTRPVKTFTIGFREAGYSEAEAARQVARHLGTEHQELQVSPGDALEVIPQLPEIYDEPFADTSQIPTFLVASLTRSEVTVALSGDGGDEAFGGYNRYLLGHRLSRTIKLCPKLLRRGCAGLLKSISPESWDACFEQINRWLPPSRRYPTAGAHLYKLAGLLTVDDPELIYERLASRWPDPEALVTGGHEPVAVLDDPSQRLELEDLTHRFMYYDAISYLPDDILVKVDRASMAVSLEVRAPLLDYRVMEFAWQLPRALKVRGGQGKLILRQVLARHVPNHLIDRPKQGFVMPLDRWLRGPLRAWAEAMLDRQRLRSEGFLDPDPVHRAWQEHLRGRANSVDRLWCILMFQAWLERWANRGTAAGSAVGARSTVPVPT